MQYGCTYALTFMLAWVCWCLARLPQLGSRGMLGGDAYRVYGLPAQTISCGVVLHQLSM
jgi:hypothetical protein